MYKIAFISLIVSLNANAISGNFQGHLLSSVNFHNTINNIIIKMNDNESNECTLVVNGTPDFKDSRVTFTSNLPYFIECSNVKTGDLKNYTIKSFSVFDSDGTIGVKGTSISAAENREKVGQDIMDQELKNAEFKKYQRNSTKNSIDGYIHVDLKQNFIVKIY